MLKLPDHFNLYALIRYGSIPVMFSLMTGCATTVDKFDPDYCMEWSETNAKALILKINSHSKSVYQNACIQGRAGAQVTLIEHSDKNLHPVSANIGKAFIQTITAQAREERRKKELEASQTIGGNDILNEPLPDNSLTFHEKIMFYYDYYLQRSGFNRQDVLRDAIPLKFEETPPPLLPAAPPGCTPNSGGFFSCKP